MVHFTELPPELIEYILLFLDPLDVSRLSQSSRLFNQLVYNPSQTSLWLKLYLHQGYDDPAHCITPLGQPLNASLIDFRSRLQRVIRARTILWSPRLCKVDERKTVLGTLLELVIETIPLKKPSDISCSLLWGYALLQTSTFIDDMESPALSPPLDKEETQLLARLHTLFGLTDKDKTRESRTKSRAYVYDMRRYNPLTAWGPFSSGGRVNWVHVQAVHHIVLMHVMDMREESGVQDLETRLEVVPMSLPYTQLAVPVIGSGEEEKGEGDSEAEEKRKEEEEEMRRAIKEDWAGVAGDWRISFCFCDHRELIKYNESATTPDGDLDISIFEDSEFGEVFRSLDVTLHVTGSIPDPQNPWQPVIQFTGVLSQGSSTMSGKVKMTPDGQVHWDFFSGEQGHAIWSSNGIHVGGLRSSFGILGTWTTVFHDIEDPVGPFWMRKRGLHEGILMDHVSH